MFLQHYWTRTRRVPSVTRACVSERRDCILFSIPETSRAISRRIHDCELFDARPELSARFVVVDETRLVLEPSLVTLFEEVGIHLLEHFAHVDGQSTHDRVPVSDGVLFESAQAHREQRLAMLRHEVDNVIVVPEE